MRGVFITLEGLDGAGTTTQLDMVANELRRYNIPVVTTKEPTNGAVGTLIREQIRTSPSPEKMTLLFAADRVEHCDTVIRPSIMRGDWVLCDRYVHSSVAYQGQSFYTPGVVSDINCFALKPDIVIYVKVPVSVALNRVEARGQAKDVFETKQVLDAAYMQYSRMSSDSNWITVDGTKPIADVTSDIMAALIRRGL